MPKLLGIDSWVEQIDQMIDRLSPLDCDKCLPEWLDRMVSNKIITEWKYSDGGENIVYTIAGQTHEKVL